VRTFALGLVSLAACAHAFDAAEDDSAVGGDASIDGARVDRTEAGAGAEAAAAGEAGDPADVEAGAPDVVDGARAVDAGLDAPSADAGICATAAVLVRRGKDATGARVMITGGAFPGGFTEEASFRVFPQPTAATKPLYQLYSSSLGDYLPSQANDEGAPSYQLTGTIGHMLSLQAAGTVLLSRYVQVAPQRHLASTNPSDVPPPFYSEGPMGYVCPP
jgi:hypothetical protein